MTEPRKRPWPSAQEYNARKHDNSHKGETCDHPECVKARKVKASITELEYIGRDLKTLRDSLPQDSPYHPVTFRLQSLVGEMIAGLNSKDSR